MKYVLFKNGESEKIVEKFSNKQVVSVSQTKSTKGVVWRGELDNDDYFLVVATLGGVITAAVGEREMTLYLKMSVVAGIDEFFDFAGNFGKNPNNLVNDQILNWASKMISTIDTIKFEDIMKLFGWTYATNNVELYEEVFI